MIGKLTVLGCSKVAVNHNIGEKQYPHIWQYGGNFTDLTCILGAPGGIRTHNRLIRSQMLYPLRYGGVDKLYLRYPRP